MHEKMCWAYKILCEPGRWAHAVFQTGVSEGTCILLAFQEQILGTDYIWTYCAKLLLPYFFNIIWHRDLLTRLYSYYKQVAKKGFIPITYVFGNTFAILLWMQAAQIYKKHILKQAIAFLGHHLSGEWFLFIELFLLYCMWKERTTKNYRGVQSGG